jgi:hypothetical protein
MQAPTPEQRKEIVRRGEAIYKTKLRATINTPENFGKMLVINVDTGDYAIDASHITAVDVVRALSPEGQLFSMRIGHRTLTRTGNTWNLTWEAK